MNEYAVVNPATGETVARYDTFSDAEVEQTLGAAEAGFETWRKLPVAERARIVRRAAELHRERREELAAIIVREMGKVKAAALGEVAFAADITEYYADQADVITADQPLTILGKGTAVIRRNPLGVLLGIMPWNFPYYQVARFAAPNLVLGNAIVLKHASQCPESAAAIEAIYRDAGLPEGAYLNVYVSNEQAATIIADPRIQGVAADWGRPDGRRWRRSRPVVRSRRQCRMSTVTVAGADRLPAPSTANTSMVLRTPAST
jgi:succinate-semialdehyde dehydrogenase/glutarate-semialdehyde dehydrogenase